ncbi:MAG: hypothetical protein ACRET8_10180 [Burkholderiales bacterium]
MDVIVAPLVAGLFATFVGIYDVKHPLDACQPPAIRVESANLATLPGPNSTACLEARKAAGEKKKAEEEERTKQGKN